MHLTLSPTRTTSKAAHARSASEPSHPALARLEATVRALRAWSCCCSGGAASSGYGLKLLEAVLAALGELLTTPRAAAALHDAAGDDDQALLDAFLMLADAHGTFGSALLAAKQSVADAEAAARRGDGAAVAASVRAHRRTTDKELRRLASMMRHASRHAPTTSADATGTTEVIAVVAEATVAMAEASAAIFSRCAAMSPDVSAMVQTVSSSHKWLTRLRVSPVASKVAPEMGSAALERLEELEECIAELESESEKVFRMLLQARVLLLNIHNPL